MPTYESESGNPLGGSGLYHLLEINLGLGFPPHLSLGEPSGQLSAKFWEC
jgi:hypothetical protein